MRFLLRGTCALTNWCCLFCDLCEEIFFDYWSSHCLNQILCSSFHSAKRKIDREMLKGKENVLAKVRLRRTAACSACILEACVMWISLVQIGKIVGRIVDNLCCDENGISFLETQDFSESILLVRRELDLREVDKVLVSVRVFISMRHVDCNNKSELAEGDHVGTGLEDRGCLVSKIQI